MLCGGKSESETSVGKLRPGTLRGPLSFLISPSKPEEIMLILITWLLVIQFFNLYRVSVFNTEINNSRLQRHFVVTVMFNFFDFL